MKMICNYNRLFGDQCTHAQDIIYAEKEPFGDDRESHGICPDCLPLFEAQSENINDEEVKK